MVRDLGLAGLPNARDLGGYRTVDGREVRQGVLFRADAPVRATEDDLKSLAALNCMQVIDLRGAQEIEMFGMVTWGVPREHLPVSDAAQEIVGLIRESSVHAAEAERLMISMYRGFVSQEPARAQFAIALHRITTNSPLLFHCTAGKDRTGWLSAIVLTALGVDRETVMADYLLTNERFTTGRGAVGRGHLLKALSELVADVNDVLPVLDARPAYLQAAFDEVDACYGTFEDFLKQGLNTDVDRMREVLLK
ncbi:tyrosine-protein phosphatase [Catelliglobosispora koreensis]|uniref:tyrosine-protein phosphatase n=1 Tax=Catelliglobosispora koreensis TaxID=129052 RepID=UPI00037ECDAA|nr:tyrosine-protein phosphatase [Catelliglobosispora koreensis]